MGTLDGVGDGVGDPVAEAVAEGPAVSVAGELGGAAGAVVVAAVSMGVAAVLGSAADSDSAMAGTRASEVAAVGSGEVSVSGVTVMLVVDGADVSSGSAAAAKGIHPSTSPAITNASQDRILLARTPPPPLPSFRANNMVGDSFEMS
ncbi:MAG: hypothetical protein KIT69_06295 [Propionibacteriaceae bacterium]|nr:hypothetical protein [Propionibacteriaceae bacterium]